MSSPLPVALGIGLTVAFIIALSIALFVLKKTLFANARKKPCKAYIEDLYEVTLPCDANDSSQFIGTGEDIGVAIPKNDSSFGKKCPTIYCYRWNPQERKYSVFHNDTTKLNEMPLEEAKDLTYDTIKHLHNIAFHELSSSSSNAKQLQIKHAFSHLVDSVSDMLKQLVDAAACANTIAAPISMITGSSLPMQWRTSSASLQTAITDCLGMCGAIMDVRKQILNLSSNFDCLSASLKTYEPPWSTWEKEIETQGFVIQCQSINDETKQSPHTISYISIDDAACSNMNLYSDKSKMLTIDRLNITTPQSLTNDAPLSKDQGKGNITYPTVLEDNGKVFDITLPETVVGRQEFSGVCTNLGIAVESRYGNIPDSSLSCDNNTTIYCYKYNPKEGNYLSFVHEGDINKDLPLSCVQEQMWNSIAHLKCFSTHFAKSATTCYQAHRVVRHHMLCIMHQIQEMFEIFTDSINSINANNTMSKSCSAVKTASFPTAWTKSSLSLKEGLTQCLAMQEECGDIMQSFFQSRISFTWRIDHSTNNCFAKEPWKRWDRWVDRNKNGDNEKYDYSWKSASNQEITSEEISQCRLRCSDLANSRVENGEIYTSTSYDRASLISHAFSTLPELSEKSETTEIIDDEQDIPSNIADDVTHDQSEAEKIHTNQTESSKKNKDENIDNLHTQDPVKDEENKTELMLSVMPENRSHHVVRDTDSLWENSAYAHQNATDDNLSVCILHSYSHSSKAHDGILYQHTTYELPDAPLAEHSNQYTTIYWRSGVLIHKSSNEHPATYVIDILKKPDPNISAIIVNEDTHTSTSFFPYSQLQNMRVVIKSDTMKQFMESFVNDTPEEPSNDDIGKKFVFMINLLDTDTLSQLTDNYQNFPETILQRAPYVFNNPKSCEAVNYLMNHIIESTMFYLLLIRAPIISEEEAHADTRDSGVYTLIKQKPYSNYLSSYQQHISKCPRKTLRSLQLFMRQDTQLFSAMQTLACKHHEFMKNFPNYLYKTKEVNDEICKEFNDLIQPMSFCDFRKKQNPLTEYMLNPSLDRALTVTSVSIQCYAKSKKCLYASKESSFPCLLHQEQSSNGTLSAYAIIDSSLSADCKELYYHNINNLKYCIMVCDNTEDLLRDLQSSKPKDDYQLLGSNVLSLHKDGTIYGTSNLGADNFSSIIDQLKLSVDVLFVMIDNKNPQGLQVLEALIQGIIHYYSELHIFFFGKSSHIERNAKRNAAIRKNNE